MAGHSKWAQIKRAKGANDAARGKLFTKLGKEIFVAVKLGGPNPDSNNRLAMAIAKARASNMPNDNVARSIKNASQADKNNYESITYEGYGPAGVAVRVHTLTDNKNRTAGEVRWAFDKGGGSMGTTNCVSYMFDKKGVIVCERKTGLSEDQIFELALEAGADDVNVGGEVFEIFTSPAEFVTVRKNLDGKNLSFISAETEWLPQSVITLDAEQLLKFQKMLDMLDENDDVQNVYHNVGLPEESEEQTT